MNIFSTIANAVSGFFKKEAPVVEHAFSSASSIVNILKTILTSPTAQTIEAVIEAFAPGVSNVVIGALNEFFTAFGLVSAEASKPASQIAADGLKAISGLGGISKVVALSNVASVIGHAISTANNGGTTIQQAIVAAPLVYDPNVLNYSTINPIPQIPPIYSFPTGTIVGADAATTASVMGTPVSDN